MRITRKRFYKLLESNTAQQQTRRSRVQKSKHNHVLTAKHIPKMIIPNRQKQTQRNLSF